MQLKTIQKIPASAGIDAIYNAYKTDGGVIIKGLYDAVTIQRVNQELQPAIEKRNPGHSDPLMNEVFGSENKRIPAVTHSKTYRDVIIENDLVHALSERALVQDPHDGYWLSVSQVIQIGPGSKAQEMHRDQWSWEFWNHLAPLGIESCVNFMVALSPFTEANGATRVVPGTHLIHDFRVTADTLSVPVEMDLGDAFFFSGMLIHGNGENVTKDEDRRGLTMFFARNSLTPEEAYPLYVPREIINSMSYRAQAMFGFRSKWPITSGPLGKHWTKNFAEIGESIGLQKK
jgi:ectoine hydroxylase-related dioxygenase (phytanoyl-CoA dioxygenase family)